VRVRPLLLVTALVLSACAPNYIDLGYDYLALATGGSTTGSGGTGGAMLCMPGEKQECYTGPKGTQGQGICKPGQQTCNADGSAYGACEGEQLPKPEDCATPLDEDCDGLAPSCKGKHLWSKRFGPPTPSGNAYSQLRDLAADGAGDVLVTGIFTNQIGFDAQTLTSEGVTDVFLGKLSGADGAVIWSKRFGDSSGQESSSVAVDATGNVFLTGFFFGSIDFGGGPLVTSGETDVFLAKLDVSGAPLWSKRFGDANFQESTSVVTDSTGDVFLAGSFAGTINLGGATLTSAGNKDLFVAKLSGVDGTHLWSKRFGDSKAQESAALAVDSAGHLLIAGSFAGTVDLGGGPLNSAGGRDIFVAKLDGTSGAHLWSKSFGAAEDQLVSSIAVHGTGAFLTGSYYGALAFDGFNLTSAGLTDLFCARVDDESGKPIWAKSFGDVDPQVGADVTTDDLGNVLLAGSFSGSIDLGGGSLATDGSTDALMGKLDGSGEHQWSKRFGDDGTQSATAVAHDGQSDALLGGNFAGKLDLGGGPLVSQSTASEVFVAKFAP